MLIADAIDVLDRLAIPLGIVVGLLLIFLVSSFRKSLVNSFSAGRKARKRFTKGPDQE